MKKTGYLLLAILNCSVVFGTAVPAVEFSGKIDGFLITHNVALVPIGARDFIYSAVDSPLGQVVSSAATTVMFGMAASIANQCSNNLSLSCGIEHTPSILSSALLIAPLAIVSSWTWYVKHAAFYKSSKWAKDEFKKDVLNVLTIFDANGRHFNTFELENFLQFALGQYTDNYRAAGKFNRNTFMASLKRY
ncbi:MAG TPA: hypothetical protein DIC42_02815 [Holosporales bacterium]|nr:hypothetical protein [Holosporales bacterium]